MVASIRLRLADDSVVFDGHTFDGRERVGESAAFELEVWHGEAVAPADVLGKAAVLVIEDARDARAIPLYVTRFTQIATSGDHDGRRYRLSLRSGLSLLELTRRPRIFQHISVPDIIARVLEVGGYEPDNVVKTLAGTHAKREYVVQYNETDAAFVRRLCEDDGLWFRFEPSDGGEKLILHDDSTSAPSSLGEALQIVHPGAEVDALVAWPKRMRAARRVGAVRLRDYDPTHAALDLEGTLTAGTDVEKSVEVYEAPGGFKTGAEQSARVKLRLEQLRADAVIHQFNSNALSLLPGTAIELEPAPAYEGPGIGPSKHFVVGIVHRFRRDESAHHLEVETIPLDVPYRLPRVTPRPRILGLHHATVTGPEGEEIHTDDKGRVHVRFPWDREGPTDQNSSLPIRVAQSNLPGPMITPRIGWEVLVAFEEGDPERPLVIGKSFNGQQLPPQSLPANKTITSIASWSSPGGGAMNAIHLEDAAGSQNIRIAAGFNKNVTVANDAVTRVAKVEKHDIKGSKGSTVGANEDVSVKQAHVVMVASQSATVGAMQKVFVKGNLTIGVSSETVLIGAALLEKVGNPVTGALNLGASAALAGIGSRGVGGQIAAFGLGLARGGVQGFLQGGWQGAANAVAGGVLGEAAGMLPPSEACAALLLTTRPLAREAGLTIEGRVLEATVGIGKGTDDDDDPTDGVALTRALRRVGDAGPFALVSGQHVTDPLRGRDWELASARAHALLDAGYHPLCLEEDIGRIGSAAGAAAIVIALAELRHRSIARANIESSPFVSWALSPDGARGAASVQLS